MTNGNNCNRKILRFYSEAFWGNKNTEPFSRKSIEMIIIINPNHKRKKIYPAHMSSTLICECCEQNVTISEVDITEYSDDINTNGRHSHIYLVIASDFSPWQPVCLQRR
jgi:pyrimidine operon attenuation protein/uracil phosphoribosyltransferase